MKLAPVILLPLVAAAASGHETATHQTLMDYGAAKAGELATPLAFTAAQAARMREGAADEDDGIRSLDHAYNPLTDGKFPLAGMTARAAAVDRWNNMTSAFLAGNLDGGDGSGAWHWLGRASHLVQDMTSPLHVFALQHATESCKFEAYWQANDPYLRTLLAGAGAPLHSDTLAPEATANLDPFTAQRLQYRFDNSCPNKNNEDIRGWSEVLAWTTYFRATFWGEVVMGTSSGSGAATAPSTTGTTFSDGYVGPQANALHAMFPGNVRWINGWLDDYFEITDRNGSVFRWMSWTDVDDFSACGSGSLIDGGWAAGCQDSSKLAVGGDNDDDGARTTGRFFFDLRELGRDTSGSYNRYCYPFCHPDGSAMTAHLHDYFGARLDPLVVRYSAGLLGLANRRITVMTAEPTGPAGFSWGRRDNFGNGPAFVAGPAGAQFHFVAKSEVALTAPTTDDLGRPFEQWLRDGATFAGNTSRTLTVNTAAAPVPAAGVTYTAVFNANLDSDGDGLPDWWEIAYFGDASSALPGADDDGDGQDNGNEYVAGTHPRDPASSFRILAITRTQDGAAAVTWSCVPGRVYQVLWSAAPAGPWDAGLPGSRIVAGPGQAALSFTDPATSRPPARFYRVRVEALP